MGSGVGMLQVSIEKICKVVKRFERFFFSNLSHLAVPFGGVGGYAYYAQSQYPLSSSGGPQSKSTIGKVLYKLSIYSTPIGFLVIYPI